jgi:hypothetical protein
MLCYIQERVDSPRKREGSSTGCHYRAGQLPYSSMQHSPATKCEASSRATSHRSTVRACGITQHDVRDRTLPRFLSMHVLLHGLDPKTSGPTPERADSCTIYGAYFATNVASCEANYSKREGSSTGCHYRAGQLPYILYATKRHPFLGGIPVHIWTAVQRIFLNTGCA